jgi:alpha-N-arabinofuranosidase
MTCGRKALDIHWESETFSAICEEHEYSGIRYLDVTATLDESGKKLVIYIVNRNEKDTIETTITLADGQFSGEIIASVINGTDIKTENSVENPNQVGVSQTKLEASGKSFTYSFEPHSVTVLECEVG